MLGAPPRLTRAASCPCPVDRFRAIPSADPHPHRRAHRGRGSPAGHPVWRGDLEGRRGARRHDRLEHPPSLKTTIPLSSDGFNVIVAPDESLVYATTAAGASFVIDAITNRVLDTVEVGPAAS